MKRMIFVLLASLAASSMSVVPVRAQSLTIITDADGGNYERVDNRDRRWQRHDRREMHRGWERRHARNSNCRTQRVETRRHGRIVVKETRVCR